MNKQDMKEMIYQKDRIREVLYSGEYKGYKFAILNLGTHPTAYVENRNRFSEYEEANEDTDYVPHGGFTYYGKLDLVEDDKTIYIGWDYAHCGDWMGYYGGNPLLENDDDRKWTTAEIYDEVKRVIDRLYDLLNSPKNCKQEQIEKMASIINKRVGTDEGCVVGYKCDRKIVTTVDTKVIAEYLIKENYINGADFVEWLKNKCKYDGHTVGVWRKNLDGLLQEYLKGE